MTEFEPQREDPHFQKIRALMKWKNAVKATSPFGQVEILRWPNGIFEIKVTAPAGTTAYAVGPLESRQVQSVSEDTAQQNTDPSLAEILDSLEFEEKSVSS